MKDIAFEKPTNASDTPTLAPERSKGSPAAPVVRTFHGDVGALVKSGNLTKTHIVLSEKRRREKLVLEERDDTHAHSPLGRTIFFLSLLLAFGIGVALYALIGLDFSGPEDARKVAPETAQQQANILLSGTSRDELVAALAIYFQDAPSIASDLRTVPIVTRGADGETAPASAHEMLRAFATRAPADDLLRTLDALPAVYGIYGKNAQTGFLALRTRSYPETFAAMLRFESQMTSDFIPLFNPRIKQSDLVSAKERSFKDERILDINARILSLPGGTSVLGYAFPDEQTLVIAGNREAIRSLIAEARKVQ